MIDKNNFKAQLIQLKEKPIFLFNDKMNIFDLPKITHFNNKYYCFYGNNKYNLNDFLLFPFFLDKIITFRRSISIYSISETILLKKTFNENLTNNETKLFKFFPNKLLYLNDKSLSFLMDKEEYFLELLQFLLNYFIPNYNELKNIYLYYQLAMAEGKNIPKTLPFEKSISKKNYELFVNKLKKSLFPKNSQKEYKAKQYAKKLSNQLNTKVFFRFHGELIEFYFYKEL